MEDKTFQKAFNEGYMLEKYVPTLSQLLTKSLKNSTTTFSEGFLAGSQQYTEEKTHKDMIVSLFKNPGFQTPGKSFQQRARGFIEKGGYEEILTFFDNDRKGNEVTEQFKSMFGNFILPSVHIRLNIR